MNPRSTSTVKGAVFQAAIDIHNAGRQVTRALLSERTGYKLAVIDDHVKTLCDDGKLRRTVPGVFEPVDVFPANRPISKTVLADGSIKIEAGDEELTLSPGEARVVGLALYGDAMELAHVKGEREVYDTVNTLKHQLRSVDRRLAEALRDIGRLEQGRRQNDLFTEGHSA